VKEKGKIILKDAPKSFDGVKLEKIEDANNLAGNTKGGASADSGGEKVGLIGGVSPIITPKDLTGKTEAGVEKFARKIGLKPYKPEPGSSLKPGTKIFNDPKTGKGRIRIERGHVDSQGKPCNNPPTAGRPHVHGYEPDGTKIRSPSGDPHFPLKGRVAVGVMSRILVGVGLLLCLQDAH
jgi:hypothetical protein